jgi:uncharacterized protein YuzE
LKVHYDPKVDILYMVIREGPIYDSRELDEDVRLEYDKKGEIVGIEVIDARRNVARVLAEGIVEQIKAASS